ncbi:methyltransferase domain-containing protein [Niveispirillum lacus]|uniref:methyltransferase domain-containing protein n=1 Tax=Niveispirillum lacus TaxID=1981099 RepID=UPI001A9C92CF|nr:methyltransferase domain-containing protein [Niveispirillum lacus]
MQWDPDLYERYRLLRERPGRDLLNAIPEVTVRSAIDLGCGTGYLTRQLVNRFAGAHIIGLDSDDAMLAKAAAVPSRIDWQQADIGDWCPSEPVDLIFSNAALHWLPDHTTLFRRLVGFGAPGGLLAVQMPDNFAAPSHLLLKELTQREPWRDSLSGALDHSAVLAAADYWRILRPYCQTVDIWYGDYLQVLEGDDPVLDWVSATALLPVIAHLPPTQAADFTQSYRLALRKAYPKEKEGSTLFPFRRIFILARI